MPVSGVFARQALAKLFWRMSAWGLGCVETPGDCGPNDSWFRIFALAAFLLPMGAPSGF